MRDISSVAIVALLAPLLATEPAAAANDVTAAYDGNLTSGASRSIAVVGALAEVSHSVSGSLDLAFTDARGGAYPVVGVRRGRHVVLRAANGTGVRLLCRLTIDSGGVLRGEMRFRFRRDATRAQVVLEPRPATPTGEQPGTCDSPYFRDTVMTEVLVPICGRCHVPGGVAEATNFRVTPSDPLATQRSVALNVDGANPSASRILLKPRAQVPHGGGQQIVPGSAADQILTKWVDIVASGQCGGKPGGGGTGNPGADLYTANCTSCHGADARGIDPKPDIHCSRAIHDVVRNGRTGGPAGDMPAFPNLTDADIATVQAYLDGLCPAPSGADLYASNCSTCHGADAGGTPGIPAARCATRVADILAAGWPPTMPAFSSFTTAEVASVSQYLDALCTASGVTGADLYGANCARCHGAAASGAFGLFGEQIAPDIRCYDAPDFVDAIQHGEDEMPAFPALDPSRIDKITTWVRALCGG